MGWPGKEVVIGFAHTTEGVERKVSLFLLQTTLKTDKRDVFDKKITGNSMKG